MQLAFLFSMSEWTPQQTVSIPTDPKNLRLTAHQSVWEVQRSRYERMWNLYTGDHWNQVEPGSSGMHGTPLLRYPLRINDAAFACQAHTYSFFGDVPDTSETLVIPKVQKRKVLNANVDEVEAQDYLEEILYESNIDWHLLKAVLHSQILGGTVLRVRFDLGSGSPFRVYPFQLEHLDPTHFYPVFATGSSIPTEVYVRYKLTRESARDTFGLFDPGWPEWVTYQEHWTSNRITIEVGDIEGNSTKQVQEPQRNPFGLVPFVYIPHYPGRYFYGIPLAEGAVGAMEEHNARLTNLGDLAFQAAMRYLIVKNNATKIDQNRDIKPLRPGGPDVIYLGFNPSNGLPAEATFEDPPAITPSLLNMVQEIQNQARISMFIPPIATGSDEGSQRSGETLHMRFWPLRAHVQMERWIWKQGLDRVASILFHCARVKGQTKNVDPKFLRTSWRFAEMFPRDRENLAAEWVARLQVGLGDPETGLSQFGDVPESEIPEVMRKAREHMEFVKSVQAPAFSGGGNGSQEKVDTKSN